MWIDIRFTNYWVNLLVRDWLESNRWGVWPFPLFYNNSSIRAEIGWVTQWIRHNKCLISIETSCHWELPRQNPDYNLSRVLGTSYRRYISHPRERDRRHCILMTIRKKYKTNCRKRFIWTMVRVQDWPSGRRKALLRMSNQFYAVRQRMKTRGP